MKDFGLLFYLLSGSGSTNLCPAFSISSMARLQQIFSAFRRSHVERISWQEMTYELLEAKQLSDALAKLAVDTRRMPCWLFFLFVCVCVCVCGLADLFFTKDCARGFEV